MGAGVVVSCWVVAALDVTTKVEEITVRVAVLQTVFEWFCMDSTPWVSFAHALELPVFSELEATAETVKS